MTNHAFCMRNPPKLEITDNDKIYSFQEKIITQLVEQYDTECAHSIAKALVDAGCTTVFIFDRKWLFDAIQEKIERDREINK